MAELLLPDVDDDFSPDPPAHEEIEFDHAIEFDISLLNQAARGEHLAWALSARSLDHVAVRATQWPAAE